MKPALRRSILRQHINLALCCTVPPPQRVAAPAASEMGICWKRGKAAGVLFGSWDPGAERTAHALDYQCPKLVRSVPAYGLTLICLDMSYNLIPLEN